MNGNGFLKNEVFTPSAVVRVLANHFFFIQFFPPISALIFPQIGLLILFREDTNQGIRVAALSFGRKDSKEFSRFIILVHDFRIQ